MDAITLLKNDHRSVQRLFRRFEAAGDDARVEKREIVDRIIEELSVHAAIEEQVFYPVVRATVPGTEDLALESLEEHHIVKWTLSELEGMDPSDERFDAKVTVLIESVRHHVDEEEHELFPEVRHELGRSAMNDLGDALEQARRTAPNHPHPRASDTPPGNVIAGAAAGVVDRVGDTVNGVAQGSVAAVNDLIAALRGRKKPRVSPTGSVRTRRTATKVRAGASEATGSTVRASKAGTRKAATKTRKTAAKAG
jgi:hemerythrin superfamily protein